MAQMHAAHAMMLHSEAAKQDTHLSLGFAGRAYSLLVGFKIEGLHVGDPVTCNTTHGNATIYVYKPYLYFEPESQKSESKIQDPKTETQRPQPKNLQPRNLDAKYPPRPYANHPNHSQYPNKGCALTATQQREAPEKEENQRPVLGPPVTPQ